MDAIAFHNPSGHDEPSKRDSITSAVMFEQYFAVCGIAIIPARS
jgi:hypothetical protein